jgi:hypothetical protein
MEKHKAIVRTTAWLVTWEWAGDHAKPAEKVVAVLNPRLGGKRVRELVELLYIQSGATLAEKLTWALHPSRNPYPAQCGILDGAPWEGEVTCSHNPWLFARLVDSIVVEPGADGKERATWKERPKPDLSWMRTNGSDR